MIFHFPTLCLCFSLESDIPYGKNQNQNQTKQKKSEGQHIYLVATNMLEKDSCHLSYELVVLGRMETFKTKALLERVGSGRVCMWGF